MGQLCAPAISSPRGDASTIRQTINLSVYYQHAWPESFSFTESSDTLLHTLYAGVAPIHIENGGWREKGRAGFHEPHIHTTCTHS